MATDVQICSNALMLLGAAPIASLSEPGSRAAVICSNVYPLARQDVLRRHNWNCGVTRVVLAPLAEKPAFDWAHQFTKPGDWLRLIQIGRLGQLPDYEFAGNRILSNLASLPLVYMAEVDEGRWDALLTGVMVKRMVADLAYPITKSTSLAEMRGAEYREALQIAKGVDAQENPPEDWGDSPLISVRG
ncbi:hypothetical protein [Pseudorhodoferax sp.]|uniref:hypothetical protein n=1 Tax=Pseudorhodoferax sp. TaxID=1993553 RepID=UPI0039E646E5